MRADRLIAAVLILQARNRVTAAGLARELEVSPRTARRDLEALQMAGVPIYSQPGRGGGWSLVGGARTNLTGLTAAETRALFLLIGPSADPVVRTAIRKLIQALPGPFRREAEGAARSVLVDPTGWGRRPRNEPDQLDALQQAVIDGIRVDITYVDRRGNASRRAVDPLGMVHKAGTWYLLADGSEGRRSFRVDRIRSVSRRDEATARPDDFDLGEAWEEVVDTVERHRTTIRATVLAEPVAVPILAMDFGRDLEVRETRADGRVELVIRAADPKMIAWRLAGWGARVEVTEPAAIRRHLAEIGRDLAGQYNFDR